MNQLKELKKKHVMCFCIVVIVLSEVLKKIPIGILDYLGLSDRSTNLGYLLLELIMLAVAVLMMYITAQGHVLRFSVKSFAKSMLSGMVFLVLAIFGCILFVTEASMMGVAYKSMPEIIAFVIFVITVGLAEEFLFRGIIADCIFERFGNSKMGIMGSVLLSGCIFGVMHLFNVLSGQSLEESIIQMIATSMLVYRPSGNYGNYIWGF